MLERLRNRASLRVPVCVGLALCAAAGTTLSAASAAGFQFGGGDMRADSLKRVLAYQPQKDALGAVELWSGGDGSLLRRVTSNESNDLFGFSATSAGDLDGDGLDDIVVGAPMSRAGGAASGRVDVISSATGKVLWSIAGSTQEMLGLAVHGLGDVDTDKVPDFAAMGTTGRGDKRLSHVTIFSGATGEPIATFYGGEPGDNFGSSVTTLGDRNGDGLAEVAIMAPAGTAGSSLTFVTPALPEAGSQEVDLARRVCEDTIDIIDIIDVIDIEPLIPIDIDILVRFRYPGSDANRTMGELAISSKGKVQERVVQSTDDLAGDVNKDGIIDDADASLVMSKLYQIVEDDSPIRTDLNHDGFTDASDLATVLVGASSDAPTTSPALLDGMRERDEQSAFFATFLVSGDRLSEEAQVVATLVSSCQGCPPCPIGNPNDPSDDQWPDGSSKPGAGPNDPWVECFHCRCCGPGSWVWQNPTQTATAPYSESDPGRSGGASAGNPGSANASVVDALPRGFWTVVESSTAIATARWNFSQSIAWIGTGPACGATWSATPQGTGSSAVNVSASAYPGVSSSASASGGGGASALGANFSFNMPTITLTATYAGLNANGDYTINVAGNGGATQTSVQGAATVSVSSSTNWTVVGTGSASGNASFFCANPVTTTKYCQLGGYTGSTNGVTTANGTGTGVWGFFSNAYASYAAYAGVSFQF